jgi:hypothetical protein
MTGWSDTGSSIQKDCDKISDFGFLIADLFENNPKS